MTVLGEGPELAMACDIRIASERAQFGSFELAAMQMLLGEPGVSAGDFTSVRSMMYFGSSISPALLERALSTFGCAFNQFYGATEAWFVAILPNEQHVDAGQRLTSCGRPLPLVSMKLMGPDDYEVAEGEVGEVLREGGGATEDELRRHCRTHLAGFKVPKTIYFESALPLTPAGKIQKPALRARFRTGR